MGNKADNGKTECNKIKHGAAKDEKKVPKLRFPEFTGEWEERKLIDEVESVDTGKSKFVASGSGKYEILGSTSVIGYEDAYDYEGDFLLTARVGANAGELYRHSGKVKISDNTVFIQGKQLDFIYYALLNFNIKKLSFGTGQPLVKASELKMKNITMPVLYGEREVIGTYLKQLDNLITHHQQKLEHLEDLKKGMLQKMFPKEGETVPEVRFPGFTGKWERRKLGDCFSERQERSADGELISVTINDGVKKFTELDRHDNSSEDKSKYKCVEIGDIAYNTMRMWQGASGISPYKGILSPAYTVLIPEDGIDSLFFSYVFKLENMLHKFQVNSQGLTSDTWNLKYNAFSGIETMVPSLEEQEKIAAYFRNFDNLITLHKHRLEHLKELKKGLLQQMFV